jgi:hypothetical protein
MMGSANASDQTAKVLRDAMALEVWRGVIRLSNHSAKQSNSGSDRSGSDGVTCIQVVCQIDWIVTGPRIGKNSLEIGRKGQNLLPLSISFFPLVH